MKKYDSVELTDEEIDTIKDIIDDFENEDQVVRERQIRNMKHKELLWNGFSNFYWDYVAHDWRIYGYGDESSGGDNQGAYYDKNINVFRAYGETVIAALSATVPPIKCLPDDADNVNDVLTAKGGSKIADLVYNHIDAPLLWVRTLFTYYIQGLVAAYNYTDEDKKYGTADIREEHDELVDGTQSICPNCGNVLMEQETQLGQEIAEDERSEYDPGDDDIKLHDLLNKDKIPCPQCQIEIDPELKANKVVVTRITGVTRQPKSRQKIEINGGLYVKVPNWARCQEECPYISYNYETHYSTLYEEYPELRDMFHELGNSKITSSDGNQLYERWGRLNPQYRGEYPLNTPTCRNWWLRPSALNCISDDKMMKKLKKKFPDGCHIIFVNEQFVTACNQNMDDHWTLMINPLSNSLTYDPLGQLEVAVQEITTNLISLRLQTTEHSIPQTFFNPKFLNAEQYSKTEVSPGSMYPTKTIGENRNISDGFHTLMTATVSPELAQFESQVNEMGQFVLGATPQIWGGSSGAGSRTASQYAMQRNGAQIRLSALTGRTVNTFWKQIFSKVIPAYMKNMLEDERIVSPKGKDSFEQVIIKKSQLDGKIGDYRLEAPEGLPQSLDQIRETLKEMLQTNNPEILAAIGAPENLPFMAQVFGLTNFVIPGEADREKQYEEIGLLLNSAPIPSMGPMNQPIEVPSVMPELTVDNHMIEAEICRNWLVGEKGRQCKTDNPEGYKNILLHLQQHMQMMQSLQQPQVPQQQGNNPESGQSQTQPPKDNVRQLRPVSNG